MEKRRMEREEGHHLVGDGRRNCEVWTKTKSNYLAEVDLIFLGIFAASKVMTFVSTIYDQRIRFTDKHLAVLLSLFSFKLPIGPQYNSY